MSEHHHEKERITYLDLSDLTYKNDVIRFLRSKLDDFAIDCFREVTKKHQSGGLMKTSFDNYHEQRKKYDAAFILLEGQGFIEVKANGVKKPYFLTIRGKQLVTYLTEEKHKKESIEENLK